MLAVDASANSPFYQTAAFLPSASRFQSLLAGTPAMAGRRQTEPHPFEDYSNERSQSERTSTRLTKKRRRWPWFLLLLLVIVFFLPNVIAMTGLKQHAIDYALTDFNGRVTVNLLRSVGSNRSRFNRSKPWIQRASLWRQLRNLKHRDH